MSDTTPWKNVYQLDELNLLDTERCSKIQTALRDLRLENAQIKLIGDVFTSEMQLALAEKPSSLQMENTYIPELLDGTEEGTYLALDLGGTNFRVLQLVLMGGQIISEVVKHYHISDELRFGDGRMLFEYLAQCVSQFVNEQGIADIPLPMGFTFSFPMKQHSLDSGCLVTWTKTFLCSDVVGNDVVRMLREALQKCGHNHIEVVAILNDTTGTLVQGALLDKKTRIGMILGTGTNACYVENADCVQHWEVQRHGERNVVIDIEWGAFGDNGTLDFIKTPYDVQVDNGSLLTNSFTFEKYISGRYLGELGRLIMYDLVMRKLLLVNAPIDLFPEPWKFGTDYISLIEQDNVDGTTLNVENILKKFGYKSTELHYTNDDLLIIKYIAAIISLRSALLISICTSKLLNRMDDNDVTVAIDGSLYKHHPRLKGWIEYYTNKFAPMKKFHLMRAEDGSGKGAALVAAIAMKIRNR